MFYWTDEKIDWYERASRYTSFHKLLSDEIEKLSNKDESILELGCGLGHVSALLSSNHPIVALDRDERVIKIAREREGKDIYITEDAETTERKGDLLLLLFYGRIMEEDRLEKLLDRANKHIIYVYSKHTGQDKTLNSRAAIEKEKIDDKLNAMGLKHEIKEATIAFNQLLLSMEEAIIFLKESYPNKDINRYLPYVKESDNKDYPFLFLNNKNIVIVDIKK